MCWNLCTEPNFECYAAPKNLDEAIKHEYEERLRDSQPTATQSDDFERGFGIPKNDGTLEEKDYIDGDEFEIVEKIRKLTKAKEDAIRECEKRYGRESFLYKEGEKRIEKLFHEEKERLDADLAEIDGQHEEETRARLAAQKES